MAKGLHRNHPHDLGIREFFGKKYIWLLNHEGQLQLHGLHREPPKDEPETIKRMRETLKQVAEDDE